MKLKRKCSKMRTCVVAIKVWSRFRYPLKICLLWYKILFSQAQDNICLEKYDVLSALGRFILRDENRYSHTFFFVKIKIFNYCRTIGFGEVKKLKPAFSS
jgi:hypothetical protein